MFAVNFDQLRFELRLSNFSGKGDLLTSGTLLEKLIVLHPNIKPVKAQLLYESYNGWIYSGRPHWRVDKVTWLGPSYRTCRFQLGLKVAVG